MGIMELYLWVFAYTIFSLVIVSSIVVGVAFLAQTYTMYRHQQ